MISRKKAEATIAVLHKAIGVCLENTNYTPEERTYAKIAYVSLNALRNSLHRFLVDKSAKSDKVKPLT